VNESKEAMVADCSDNALPCSVLSIPSTTEFEISTNGRLRYVNSTNYKGERDIRKEFCVTTQVLQEMERIVRDSQILREEDKDWPQPNRDGKQNLEIHVEGKRYCYVTCKLGTLSEVEKCSKDPEALKAFYYLVQDLKSMVLSLINVHFKVKPI